MLRLNPPENKLLMQRHTLSLCWGGAKANVVESMARNSAPSAAATARKLDLWSLAVPARFHRVSLPLPLLARRTGDHDALKAGSLTRSGKGPVGRRQNVFETDTKVRQPVSLRE